MADEDGGIVTRPPSNPIASTLLIVSCLGLGVGIGTIWMELFTEYLPSASPGQKVLGADVHNPRSLAEQGGPHDYYKRDYPSGDEVLLQVETELGISNRIGDPNGAPASPAPGN